MNGIGVHCNIEEFELDATHGLLCEGSLLGGPLEGRYNVVLDFTEVLDTNSVVDEYIRARCVRTEAPDLSCEVNIPAKVIGEFTATSLDIISRLDLTIIDSFAELVTEWLGLHVQTVVLVWRLGKAHAVGLFCDSFTEGHNRIALDNWCTLHEVLLEVLKANFKVELTRTRNDVLARLGSAALHNGIRLGETLEAFDQLGQVGSILGADRLLHNRRDGVFHHFDVVCFSVVGVGDGTSLEDELVNANNTHGVTTWKHTTSK